MEISVGVPAYNQGSYLRQTLESVFAQKQPFHEIVVSNNHSTDSTAEVLKEIERKHPGRIRVVSPPRRMQMSEHWNFTASQLTCEWFTLLSSDDLACPNFVQSLSEAARRCSDAVLVRGGWIVIDGDGREGAGRRLLSVPQVSRPPRSIRDQKMGPKGSFAAFALRRVTWEAVGGFPEQVTMLADWGMWLLAGALGATVTTRDLISRYRTGHQDSLNRTRYDTFVRDMRVIYREVMPRATRLCGADVPAWIARASEVSFRRVLTAASRSFPPGEREELTEAFRSWAQDLNEMLRLERFARGAVFRSSITSCVDSQWRKVAASFARHTNRMS